MRVEAGHRVGHLSEAERSSALWRMGPCRFRAEQVSTGGEADGGGLDEVATGDGGRKHRRTSSTVRLTVAIAVGAHRRVAHRSSAHLSEAAANLSDRGADVKRGLVRSDFEKVAWPAN